MTTVRVIVFAKAPAPRHAKTRLIPALGAEGAASLARRMLADTLAAALAADVGPVELAASPALDDPQWHAFRPPPAVQTSDQGEGGLGARMARAADRACARGEAVVLIGTDCPTLTADRLREAADILRGGRCVIHPAMDGGYVLLGLTRFDPRVFAGIAWSTDTVAASTIERLQALGWPLHVGAPLRDVDTPGDLAHLPARLRTP